MNRKLIGESMIEADLIDNEQLDELLEYQKSLDERVPLAHLSVQLGIVAEYEFAEFIAGYFNMPYMSLEEHPYVDKRALDTLPEHLAKKFNVLPVRRQNGTLTVAISDPMELETLEGLETYTHCKIKAVVSPADKIKFAIMIVYQPNKFPDHAV